MRTPAQCEVGGAHAGFDVTECALVVALFAGVDPDADVAAGYTAVSACRVHGVTSDAVVAD